MLSFYKYSLLLPHCYKTSALFQKIVMLEIYSFLSTRQFITETVGQSTARVPTPGICMWKGSDRPFSFYFDFL